MLKLWKYTHYKNKNYEVISVGKHSDTLEDFVIYKALYDSKEFGNNAIWIKSLEDFSANITINWKEVKRFRYIW